MKGNLNLLNSLISPYKVQSDSRYSTSKLGTWIFWWFHMGVSKNREYPQIIHSIINHPFWGTLFVGNTHDASSSGISSSDACGLGPRLEALWSGRWNHQGSGERRRELRRHLCHLPRGQGWSFRICWWSIWKRWWLKTRFCMFCPRNRSPCLGKLWVLHDSFSWKTGRLNSQPQDISLPFYHVRKLGYRCVFVMTVILEFFSCQSLVLMGFSGMIQGQKSCSRLKDASLIH